MDVFSTELGIRISFVKTSEFRGGGVEPTRSPLGTPLGSGGKVVIVCVYRGSMIPQLLPKSGVGEPTR
jgi:hypothetical protein